VIFRPRPRIGAWSTYTVVGLIGYAVAAAVVGVIGALAGATLLERALAIVVPPFGFWVAIAVEHRASGVERIVFYRTSIAAWLLALVTALALGARCGVVSDLVVLLVATFLAFGRVGCFNVACCHGRPARFGVIYTEHHAALGLPRRWIGVALVPVQLLESLASALLAVVVAVLVLRSGAATAAFVVGYAVVRFGLEYLRGDDRPRLASISEAQWIALLSSTIAAIASRSLMCATGPAVLALAAFAQATRGQRLVRGHL
jgi:prolipoprotein diacylglyceryltransferase